MFDVLFWCPAVEISVVLVDENNCYLTLKKVAFIMHRKVLEELQNLKGILVNRYNPRWDIKLEWVCNYFWSRVFSIRC